MKSNSILGKVVTQATLQFAMDVIVGKCQIAKRENEFIYHDKVPESDNLPELKGQALVKGFPFDVNQVAGKDIFHKLIPLGKTSEFRILNSFEVIFGLFL